MQKQKQFKKYATKKAPIICRKYQKYVISGNKQKSTIFRNIWKYAKQCNIWKYEEKNEKKNAKICKDYPKICKKYAKYAKKKQIKSKICKN